MALDWLLKNSAVTSAESLDYALRPRFLPFAPKAVFAAVREAVERTPNWRAAEVSELSLKAERTTGFMRFTDDIEITVSDHPHGALVNIKSASRVGVGDFGQNKRNALEILAEASRTLMDEPPPEGHEGLLFCHYTPYPFERITRLFFNPDFLPVVSPQYLGVEIGKRPERPDVGERMEVIVGGVLSWVVEFIEWDPPRAFADKQVKGPFESFYHHHAFTDTGDGTVICDRVFYRMKLGRAGGLLAGSVFMDGVLASLFAQRAENLERYLEKKKV